MRFLRRLYLFRCFEYNRVLFFAILLFISMVIYGHRSSCEITPAFTFGMYSQKSYSTRDSFFLIQTDDNRYLNLWHTADEPRRMMIFSTLAAFHRGAINLFQDPARPGIERVAKKHPFMRSLAKAAFCKRNDYEHYLPWLLEYTKKAVDPSIRKLNISITYIHYDLNNLPVADSTKQLYKIEQNDP
jgi:hypothetical protein